MRLMDSLYCKRFYISPATIPESLSSLERQVEYGSENTLKEMNATNIIKKRGKWLQEILNMTGWKIVFLSHFYIPI
jgi:hypothetical protein